MSARPCFRPCFGPCLRRSFLLVVTALALVAGGPTARAEDPAAAEAVDAEHSQSDIRLAAEGLPEGWALVGSAEAAADEAALKDAVIATAKAPAAKVHVLGRSATTPDGKKAIFALVDLDEALPEAIAALKAAAEAKGWAVERMGHARRWVVVAAPADVRAKAVEVQKAYAVRMLGTRATSALSAGSESRALGLARAMLAMDAKSAVGNFVAGRLVTNEALQVKAREGEAADAILAKGIALLKAAVAKDATGTLTDGERAIAGSELGLALLYTKKADAEARDVLKQAVAGTFDEPRAATLARYNLACAHGRLKELDAAFAELGAVLEAETKAASGHGGSQLLGAWRADEDFTNLRADARWAELEKKYPAPGGSGDN